jgi:SMC interacting uncharacterized protein involved in chromosome segregation
MNLEDMIAKVYDKAADLADMKKELKGMEKDTDDIKELKGMMKELRDQVKGKKENNEKEWMKDAYYKELRDDIVKLDGDMKELKSKIYDKIGQMAAKGELVDMELTSGADSFRVQSKNEPIVFINGRKLK